MIYVDLDQGTPEWENWRDEHWGALSLIHI